MEKEQDQNHEEQIVIAKKKWITPELEIIDTGDIESGVHFANEGNYIHPGSTAAFTFFAS